MTPNTNVHAATLILLTWLTVVCAVLRSVVQWLCMCMLRRPRHTAAPSAPHAVVMAKRAAATQRCGVLVEHALAAAFLADACATHAHLQAHVVVCTEALGTAQRFGIAMTAVFVHEAVAARARAAAAPHAVVAHEAVVAQQQPPSGALAPRSPLARQAAAARWAATARQPSAQVASRLHQWQAAERVAASLKQAPPR